MAASSGVRPSSSSTGSSAQPSGTRTTYFMAGSVRDLAGATALDTVRECISASSHSLAVLIVTGLVVAGCSSRDGSKASTTTSTTRATSSSTDGTTTTTAGADLAAVNVKLTKLAELQRPTAMAVRPGDHSTALPRREGRAHPHDPRRKARRCAGARHLRRSWAARRTSRDCSASHSHPTGRSSTSTTRTRTATPGWTSTRSMRRERSRRAHAGRSSPRTNPSRTTTAASSASGLTACSTSASVTGARPATRAPATCQVATASRSGRGWARSCGSTRLRVARTLTRSRRTTRL